MKKSPHGPEATFFRALNEVVEPAVRAGLGSPCFWPTGVIVIESTGRHTGVTHRSPVVAAAIGEAVIVSTVRGERSQWLKNLAATPRVRYWRGGLAHEALAITFSPDTPLPDVGDMPALLRPLVPGLAFLCAGFGMGFAVLIPRTATAGDGTTAS